MKQITVEDMIRLQNDVLDISAQKILPFLLDNIDVTKLFYQERESYEELRSWDYEFHADQIAPAIYEYWWEELSQMIWADELETPYGNIRMPRRDVTIELILDDPTSEYFDDKTTPSRERLKDIIVKSFHSANNKLFDELGSMGNRWQWGRLRPVNIGHISQIDGLGRIGLPKGGNMHTLNYKDTSFGPSWRMVVSLSERVKGWGVYPGGQSGNPGSEFYDNFVDDWVAGNMYELLFLQSPEERDEQIIGRTVMRIVN
jgi:penicillin amidase